MTFARTFAYAMGQAPDTAPLHSALDSLWWNRQDLTGWPLLAHQLHAEFERLVERKRERPDSVEESLETLESQLMHLRSILFSTAIDQVNEAAAKIAEEHPELTWDRACERALLENPRLYTHYLQQKADTARGTGAESALAVPGARQHAARKRSERRKRS